MSASSSVNIAELIDGRPLGRMQITIIVLCGLVALLDGFDLLAIGVAAPAMAGPLHIAPNQLGAVFSAALFGLMFGAFGLGPIADRYGRRCVLISATAMFGVFALGSVFGTPLAGFLVSRFAVRSVLPAALVGSALTLGGVGYASQSIILVIMLMGLAGFFLGVASSGLIALAPLLYSTAIRSTGVGWAMGLGRLGSFVGPLAIGLLVNRGWQVGSSFVAIGAPALCAALFTSLIGTNQQERTLRVPSEKHHQQKPRKTL